MHSKGKTFLLQKKNSRLGFIIYFSILCIFISFIDNELRCQIQSGKTVKSLGEMEPGAVNLCELLCNTVMTTIYKEFSRKLSYLVSIASHQTVFDH